MFYLTKRLPQNILAILGQFIWSYICLKTHIHVYGSDSIRVITNILLLQMTSVERIVQYNHLDQEAPWVAEVVPPDTWPDQGHISLKDVSLRYPGQESLALRDVTLTVKAREKVRVEGSCNNYKDLLYSAKFLMFNFKVTVHIIFTCNYTYLLMFCALGMNEITAY